MHASLPMGPDGNPQRETGLDIGAGRPVAVVMVADQGTTKVTMLTMTVMIITMMPVVVSIRAAVSMEIGPVMAVPLTIEMIVAAAVAAAMAEIPIVPLPAVLFGMAVMGLIASAATIPTAVAVRHCRTADHKHAYGGTDDPNVLGCFHGYPPVNAV